MTKIKIPCVTKKNIFNRLAEFIDYDHNNVLCKILEKQIVEDVELLWTHPIVIPIYYPKYVCKRKDAILFTFLSLIV
jgi:hypothetical protein